jgi:hypothetical protein
LCHSNSIYFIIVHRSLSITITVVTMQEHGHEYENDLEDYDAFGMSHGRHKAQARQRGSPSSRTNDDDDRRGAISPQFYMNADKKTFHPPSSDGASSSRSRNENHHHRGNSGSNNGNGNGDTMNKGNAASQEDDDHHHDVDPDVDHDDMSSVTSATSNASTISSSHHSKYSRDSGFYSKKPVIRLEMSLDEKDDIIEEAQDEPEGAAISIDEHDQSTPRPRTDSRSSRHSIRSSRSRTSRSQSRSQDLEGGDHPIPRTVSSQSNASVASSPHSHASSRKPKSSPKYPNRVINPHRQNEVLVRNEVKSWLHLLVEVNYDPQDRPYQHNQIVPDESTKDKDLHAYYGSDEDPSTNEEGKDTELDDQLQSLLSLLRTANDAKVTDADDEVYARRGRGEPRSRRKTRRPDLGVYVDVDTRDGEAEEDDSSPKSQDTRASYDSDLSSQYLKPLPTLSDINASPTFESYGRSTDEHDQTSASQSTNRTAKKSNKYRSGSSSHSYTKDGGSSKDLQIYPSVDSCGTDLSALYKDDSLAWSKSSVSGTSPASVSIADITTKHEDKDGVSPTDSISKSSSDTSNVKKVFSFYNKDDVENAAAVDREPSADSKDGKDKDNAAGQAAGNAAAALPTVTSPMSDRENALSNMLDAFDTDIEESTKKTAGYTSTSNQSDTEDEGTTKSAAATCRLLIFSKSTSSEEEEEEQDLLLPPQYAADTTKPSPLASPAREKPKATRSILDAMLGKNHAHAVTVGTVEHQTDTEYEGDDSDEDTNSRKSGKSLRSTKSNKSVLSRMSSGRRNTPKATQASTAGGTPPHMATRRRSSSAAAAAGAITAIPKPERLEDSDEEISEYSFGSRAGSGPGSVTGSVKQKRKTGMGAVTSSVGRRARSRSHSASRARSNSRSSSQNPKKRWSSFVAAASGAMSAAESDMGIRARNKSLMPPLPMVRQTSKVKAAAATDHKDESVLLAVENKSFEEDDTNKNWTLDPLAPTAASTAESNNKAVPKFMRRSMMADKNNKSPPKHPNKENETDGDRDDQLKEDPGGVKASVFSPARNIKDKSSSSGTAGSVLGEIKKKSMTPFRKSKQREDFEKLKKKDVKLLSSSSCGDEEDLTPTHGRTSGAWGELDVPHDELAMAYPNPSAASEAYPYGTTAKSTTTTKWTSNTSTGSTPSTSRGGSSGLGSATAAPARPSQASSANNKSKPAPTMIDSDGFLLDASMAVGAGGGASSDNNNGSATTPDANAFDATFGISEDDFWGGVLPGFMGEDASGPSAGAGTGSPQGSTRDGAKKATKTITTSSSIPASRSPDDKRTLLDKTKSSLSVSTSISNSNNSMDDTFYENEQAMRGRAKALLDSKLVASARVMSPSALMEMQFGDSNAAIDQSNDKRDIGRGMSNRNSQATAGVNPSALSSEFDAQTSPTLSMGKSVDSTGNRSSTSQRRRERNQLFAGRERGPERERHSISSQWSNDSKSVEDNASLKSGKSLGRGRCYNINTNAQSTSSKQHEHPEIQEQQQHYHQETDEFGGDAKSVNSKRSGKSGKSAKSSQSRREKKQKDPYHERHREKPTAVDFSDTKSVDSIKSGKSGRSSNERKDRKEAKKLLKLQLQQNEEAQRVDAVEAATKRRIESLRKMIAEAGNDATTESLQHQLDLIERDTMKKISKVKQKQACASSLNNLDGKNKQSDRTNDKKDYSRSRRSTRTHSHAAERFQPLADDNSI